MPPSTITSISFHPLSKIQCSTFNGHHEYSKVRADAALIPQFRDEKALRQASRVIESFQTIISGEYIGISAWNVFPLIEKGFSEVEHRLAHDKSLGGLVDDKIRYDYEPSANRLTIRMPTTLHELFNYKVETALLQQLAEIGKGTGKASSFARLVGPRRSSTIIFPPIGGGKVSWNSPDASFCYKGARYPGLIVEISYASKRKDLTRLANKYLLHSDHSIVAVVGLDVEYGRTKTPRLASLSLWKARKIYTETGVRLEVVRVIKDQIFRDEAGNPTNTPGLRLSLNDFVSEEIAKPALEGEDQELVVSAQQLCDFLEIAEAEHLDSQHGPSSSLPPGSTRVGEPESSPEHISSTDESDDDSHDDAKDPNYQIAGCAAGGSRLTREPYNLRSRR